MRSFAGIKGLSYIGSLYRQPQNLAPNSSFVPIQIDWSTYFTLAGGSPANLGINVNLQSTGGPLAKAISKIVSVYIDNLGSNIPIYVYFPDSGFVVVAPPNTATWYPCITGQLLCTIFAEGLNASNVPLTRLFFTDVFVPPYADAEINQAVALWLASPSITRGTTILNTNYGAPALCDQIISHQHSNSNVNAGATLVLDAAPLFGTPLTSGFIYVNMIDLTLASSAASASSYWALQSTGAAGILLKYLLGLLTVNVVTKIFTLTGLNLKLDATQTWQTVIFNSTGGAITFSENTTIGYTVNPN